MTHNRSLPFAGWLALQ